MKKLLMLPLLASVALPALALEPLLESGFGGMVNLGYAGGEIKTNFLAEIDGPDIDLGQSSIDSFGDPESEGLGLPLVNFDIGYVFADRRMRISVANDFSDLVEFDRTTRVSLRYDFDSLGQMRVDYLHPAGLATKVYADPYQLNVDRSTTDMETSGGQLIWDGMFGSDFGVELAIKKRDIEDEMSGQALGLSAADQDLLDRNGDIRTFEVNYSYKVDARHTVRPAIGYIDRDLDGKAMAQDGVALSVAHSYQASDIVWASRIAYTDLSGDKTNPIFNDKNGANGFAVASNVAFPGSIGFLGQWTPNLSVNWSEQNNNIDFNNFGMWTVGAALSRRF